MLLVWLAACSGTPGTDSMDSPIRDSETTAAGELSLEQLYVSGWSTGETMLIVGPGGTSVLVDMGNDSHDDEVLDALDARLGSRAVDWVLLTHFHEDHVGGFDKLFEDANVEIRQGLIYRGPYDLDPSDTNPTRGPRSASSPSGTRWSNSAAVPTERLVTSNPAADHGQR